MQYDNTNKIAIFVNNRPDRADNAPMLTGRVNVEGVDYRVSLWSQKSNKDGSVFWSGKIQKDEPREMMNNGGLPPGATGPTPTPAEQPAEIGDVGDDIPF